jgi:hypothetical protein
MVSQFEELIFLDDEYKGGTAIPLVCTEAGVCKFSLCIEAEDMIKNLKAPIGIISVVGKIKSGKSYLLNKLILNLAEGGFSVGSSVDPCTKGLWIWSRPLRRLLPCGQVINILVIDTQGLGSAEGNVEQDLNLFALTALLSSYMIYNSFGHIDEGSIANLSLVAELAKIIQIRSCKDDEHRIITASAETPFFMYVCISSYLFMRLLPQLRCSYFHLCFQRRFDAHDLR